MAAQALTNVQVFVNQFDLSAMTGSIEQSTTTKLPDVDNLAGGGYNHVTPSTTAAAFGIKAWYDTATLGTYNAFTGAQRGRQDVVGFVPAGTAAVAGDVATFGRGQLASWSGPIGAIGDAAGLSAMWTGDTALVAGVVGAPLASRSATLTGTSLQLGAVAASANGATERLWAALFVTAASGTNLAVTIQTDNATGFPSPASGITFSTVSAVGAQFASAVGPLTDDWFRVSATIGTGSFSFAVLMGVY
jgi:hypothetical protein